MAAETAGLAVGVAGLAACFKACIDLFDYYYTAKTLEENCDNLIIKLDMEKALLLQWADQTHLLDPSSDSLLTEPLVVSTVQKTLQHIESLLSDGEKLQSRYGLRTKPIQSSDASPMAQRSLLSDARLERITQALKRLNIQAQGANLASSSDIRLSRFRKLRWAIHDRNRFSELLSHLSYFVSKLRELAPGSREEIRSMHREDLFPITSVDNVRRVGEAASDSNELLVAAAEERMEQIIHERILNCLWFRRMHDRRDSLSMPNPKTFQWALSETSPQPDWDEIPKWLRNGSGIYWICGKAGSGKSTLMKFLYQHEFLQRCLTTWAESNPLTFASFFFYDLGTDEQKSQRGLTRALLHDVLRGDLALTKQLLPDMWKEARKSDSELMLPSPAEMDYAFAQLSGPQSRERRYCFFIDGIDEFSGRPDDVVELLQRIGRASHIKIMASSRPIPACTQGFSSCPRLDLQRLTRGDMMAYVEEKLDCHMYVARLSDRERALWQPLKLELVRKASGVFLWIVLVCRTLLDSFNNSDRLYELRERIDELPDELEKLFELMFKRISRSHRRYAYQMMLICRERYLNRLDTLPTLGLALSEDYGILADYHPEFPNLSHDEMYAKCLSTEQRLRARCCGLVEICLPDNTQLRRDHCFHVPPHDDITECREILISNQDFLVDSSVDFVHRSVLEYLDTEGFKAFILDMNLPYHAFDANLALVRIALHAAGACRSFRRAERYLMHIFLYGAKVHPQEAASLRRAFAAIPGKVKEPTRDSLRIRRSDFETCWIQHDPEGHMALVSALETGQISLFEACWRDLGFPSLTSLPFDVPLLFRAVARPSLRALGLKIGAPCNPDTVLYLLDRGCDPNQTVPEENGEVFETSWTLILKFAFSSHEPCAFEILKLLIQHNANLQAAMNVIKLFGTHEHTPQLRRDLEAEIFRKDRSLMPAEQPKKNKGKGGRLAQSGT